MSAAFQALRMMRAAVARYEDDPNLDAAKAEADAVLGAERTWVIEAIHESSFATAFIAFSRAGRDVPDRPEQLRVLAIAGKDPAEWRVQSLTAVQNLGSLDLEGSTLVAMDRDEHRAIHAGQPGRGEVMGTTYPGPFTAGTGPRRGIINDANGRQVIAVLYPDPDAEPEADHEARREAFTERVVTALNAQENR